MNSRDLLTDEVWSQLDHSTTHLARRDRWAVAITICVLATVLGLAILARLSGFVHPRLSVDFTSSEQHGHTLTETFQVNNDDWGSDTIVDVAMPWAGTRVTSVVPGRLTIPAGKSRMIVVHAVVTDCAALTGSDQQRLRVQVKRPWGHATDTITVVIAGPPVC